MPLGGRTGLILAIAALTVVVNLPFGYMRNRVRKYSLLWFFYIHVPIPLIIFIRISSGLDYRVIPVFVFAAVAGQIVGGRLGSDRSVARGPTD